MADYKIKGLKKVEDAVVGTYKKIEDKFVDTFLEKTEKEEEKNSEE